MTPEEIKQQLKVIQGEINNLVGEIKNFDKKWASSSHDQVNGFASPLNAFNENKIFNTTETANQINDQKAQFSRQIKKLNKSITDIEQNILKEIKDRITNPQNYIKKEVSSNGSCLYYSVLASLPEEEKEKKELKELVKKFKPQIADELQTNWESAKTDKAKEATFIYKAILDKRTHENNKSAIPKFLSDEFETEIKNYIKGVKTENEHNNQLAGHVEAFILALKINHPIVIIKEGFNAHDIQDDKTISGNPIFVDYDNVGHYQAYLPIGNNKGKINECWAKVKNIIKQLNEKKTLITDHQSNLSQRYDDLITQLTNKEAKKKEELKKEELKKEELKKEEPKKEEPKKDEPKKEEQNGKIYTIKDGILSLNSEIKELDEETAEKLVAELKKDNEKLLNSIKVIDLRGYEISREVAEIIYRSWYSSDYNIKNATWPKNSAPKQLLINETSNTRTARDKEIVKQKIYNNGKQECVFKDEIEKIEDKKKLESTANNDANSKKQPQPEAKKEINKTEEKQQQPTIKVEQTKTQQNNIQQEQQQSAVNKQQNTNNSGTQSDGVQPQPQQTPKDQMFFSNEAKDPNDKQLQQPVTNPAATTQTSHPQQPNNNNNTTSPTATASTSDSLLASYIQQLLLQSPLVDIQKSEQNKNILKQFAEKYAKEEDSNKKQTHIETYFKNSGEENIKKIKEILDSSPLLSIYEQNKANGIKVEFKKDEYNDNTVVLCDSSGNEICAFKEAVKKGTKYEIDPNVSDVNFSNKIIKSFNSMDAAEQNAFLKNYIENLKNITLILKDPNKVDAPTRTFIVSLIMYHNSKEGTETCKDNKFTIEGNQSAWDKHVSPFVKNKDKAWSKHAPSIKKNPIQFFAGRTSCIDAPTPTPSPNKPTKQI